MTNEEMEKRNQMKVKPPETIKIKECPVCGGDVIIIKTWKIENVAQHRGLIGGPIDWQHTFTNSVPHCNKCNIVFKNPLKEK